MEGFSFSEGANPIPVAPEGGALVGAESDLDGDTAEGDSVEAEAGGLAIFLWELQAADVSRTKRRNDLEMRLMGPLSPGFYATLGLGF